MEQTDVGLKLAEACERLGCRKTKLYDLLKANEISAHKVGAATRFSSQSIDDFIARNAWRSLQCRA